jgi:uncharacterized protein (TIGR03437 family)
MRSVVALALAPSLCFASDLRLVISQVLPSNYVEIFNAGAGPVDLEGFSVQVGAGNRPWDAKPLHGVLAPGQHHLAYTNGSSLPVYAGSVALIRQIEPVQGTWPNRDQIIDLFAYARTGYHGLDQAFDGRSFVGPPEAAYFRKNGGCLDTDDNSADFYASPPQPRDWAAPAAPCPESSWAPTIASVGVRHAATLQSGPLAPGTLAVLDGTGFVSGHTQVFFDSVPAHLSGITSNRIILTIPAEAPVNRTVQITVRVDGLSSAARAVSLTATAPGVFGRSNPGMNVSPPLDQEGKPNTPESTTDAGSSFSFSCTGLGAADNPRLAVSVGGHSAEITGLEPERDSGAGVFRVTIRLPASLSPGVQRLILSAGGVTSPAEYVYLSETPANTDWGRIAAGARDLAYDPFRNLIYAGTADDQLRSTGAVPAHPNSVLVIDPRQRSIVQVIPCGSSPYRLALSAHGRYLWLALDRDQQIQRINLDTRKVEFKVLFADLFADFPGVGTQSVLGSTIQLRAMQPDPVDDEVLVLASPRTPTCVLRGNTRLPRLGPMFESVVPNPDGSFWTESYRFRLSVDGVEVLEKPSEVVPPLIAPLGDVLIDEVNVIRRTSDLRRLGVLNILLGGPGLNVVFRPGSGSGYIGGGSNSFSLAAFDVERLLMTEFWAVGLPGPGTSFPGRLVTIGSEGFAVAFGMPYDGTFGLGAGGDILFVPSGCLRPVDALAIPEAQPASGAIRYFPVPVQGATVDQASGRVYFSLGGYVPGIGNSVLPFNSVEGRFGDPIWVGSEPYVGAVPADGQFLYLSLAGSRMVKRFKLPDVVEDAGFGMYDWTFGWFVNAGVPQNVNVLEVPGALSTTIAVERGGGWGVAIFDDGVERPKKGGYDSVQFSPSGQWLFALGNTISDFPFSRYSVTPDGLVKEAMQTDLVEFYGGFGNLLRCGEAVCVTSNGMVLDPFQMQRIRVLDDGPFMCSRPMLALDPEMDRAYFYLPSGTIPNAPTLQGGIHSYSISTGKRTGSLIGTFRGSDMQLLPTGELMLTGRDGITLVPKALVN